MISSSPRTPLFSSSALGNKERWNEIGDSSKLYGALHRALEEARPQIRPDKKSAWRWVLSASLSLVLFYAWMCLFCPFGETVNKDCSNVFTVLMSLLGTSACLVCAMTRRDAPTLTRVGWTVLGLGWGFSTLGESMWLLNETLRREEVPFPSISDVWFVLCYVALLLGMILIFRDGCSTNRPRIILDSALLAGTFGALAWFFVLQPVWTTRGAMASFPMWIELSYPLFDVLLLWAALALVYIPVRYGSASRANNFVASSTALLASTGLWYAFLSVSGNYSSGGLNDLAAGSAYGLVGLSMLAIAWDREPWQTVSPSLEQEEDEANSLMRVLLPYFFTLCVFTLIACHQWRTTRTLGLDVLAWCLVFLGIIMARQMVSLSENMRLARQMRFLNKGLDTQVQSRTRQLDAMLQLTKAVNASLVEEEVVEQAVTTAHYAVSMSAAAVWNWNAADESVRLVGAQGGRDLWGGGWQNFFADEQLSQLASQVARTDRALDCCEDDLSVFVGAKTKEKISTACLHLEPIRFNGHVLGVLGALRDQSGQNKAPFTSDEARLLENIGLEVGAALQNARVYARAVDAADRDAATGLLNHRAMQARFEVAWEQAQFNKTPLSVVMMDLDNFKNFNDTYGHLVGDEVLRLVAHTLKQVCRDKDFVARYGGDEFFMLLPETDTDGALCVARRLQESMSQAEFRPNGSHDTLPLSLSFGVATAPTDARSKLELVAAADKNLYTAKGSRDAIRSTSKVLQKRLTLLSDEGTAALDAMVTAVSNADDYTRQHSEDVTRYALWIAEELELDEATRRTIEVGGMLHDVGKICVPQEILKKPGSLSEVEFAAMQTHPVMGALLVRAVLPDSGILQIVRSHHERFDGRGYPDALQGENIPFLGRIVAVADAFSAMTTSRPYRKALSLEQARHEIERGIGTQFDPQLANAFIHALDKHLSP